MSVHVADDVPVLAADAAQPSREPDHVTQTQTVTIDEDHTEATHASEKRLSVKSDNEKEGLEDEQPDTKEVAEQQPDDESQYPHGFPLIILTVGLCLALFVVALDNTIIATAIPTITTVFDSLNDVGWYGSAYLLTTTSLQPSFGKIYTHFNVKYTFLFALALFELGSIICAAATSSPMLIIGRAVAGAGAAAIFSGGMTIMAYSVPLRKRAIYVAALSSMFGIASVVGPLLGGALTDQASWRWCFWINLPFGGVAIATTFIFFKEPTRIKSELTTREKIKEIDLLGASFLISGIVCLLLALQWGGTTFAWNNSKIYGLFIGFGLLIIVFVLIQFRLGDKATIPFRIIRQRTVWTTSVFNALLSMALYTHIYYLPFYFQAVKGTSAEGSGIRTIPYLVSITIGSVVIGGAITVVGFYTPFMWAGSAIFTVGCGLLSVLKVNTSTGTWIGYQILAGAGAGASVQIPFLAVQTVLSEKDIPTGNAISVFSNTLGGAISISIAQNVFANKLVQEVPKYTTGIDGNSVLAIGATHLRDSSLIPADQLPGVLQAYTVALNTAFIFPIATGALAFCLSLLVEWRSIKGKQLMGGVGA